MRKSLTTSPTATQIISAYATWITDASTGITLGASVNGVVLEDVAILGFNQAISADSGEFSFNRVWIDCNNGVTVANAGDNSYMTEVRCEPFYAEAAGVSPTSGALDHSGVAFAFTGSGNTGPHMTNCFSFMWRTGLSINGAGAMKIVGLDCEVVAGYLYEGNSSNTIGINFPGTVNCANIEFTGCQILGYGTCLSVSTTGQIMWHGGELAIAYDGYEVAHVVQTADCNSFVAMWGPQINLSTNTSAGVSFQIGGGNYSIKLVAPWIANGLYSGGTGASAWITIGTGTAHDVTDATTAAGVVLGLP